MTQYHVDGRLGKFSVSQLSQFTLLTETDTEHVSCIGFKINLLSSNFHEMERITLHEIVMRNSYFMYHDNCEMKYNNIQLK